MEHPSSQVSKFLGPGIMEATFMSHEKQRVSASLYGILFLREKSDFELAPQGQVKSVERSDVARVLANDIYQKKPHTCDDHLKIWKLFSESLAMAPLNSGQFMSAYYNRATILHHLENYQDCLKDIDRALGCKGSSGDPAQETLVMNLICRKAECFAMLSDTSADEFINSTIGMIKKLTIKEDLKFHYIAKLKSQKSYRREKPSKGPKPNGIRIKPIEFNHQEEIPCASDALTLNYDAKFGRHVVATRDIAPGEILAAEKVYSYFLHQTAFYSHCGRCASKAWAAIPCQGCIYAMYCSEECKKAAWAEYHDIECRVIDKLWITEDPEESCKVLLSVRLVIRALKEFGGDIQELKKMVKSIDFDEDIGRRGFTDGVLRSDLCKSVLSLLTNSNKRKKEGLQKVSKISAMAVYWLANCTKVFDNSLDGMDVLHPPIHKDVKFIGALITRMYYTILTNQFTLKEEIDMEPRRAWMVQSPEGKSHMTANLGIIIAPFCSLINHSCIPNAATCISETGKLLLFSINAIPKHSQIFISYDGLNYGAPKMFREEYMQRHFITCDCVACKENWPVFKEAPIIKDLTEEKRIFKSLSVINKQLWKLTMEEEDLKEAVAESLDKVVKKKLYPSQDFYRLMDILTHLHIVLHGKWFQVPGPCSMPM